MASEYSESILRVLSGMSWIEDEPHARAAGYQLRALLFKPNPGNILHFTCSTLELFQRDPDHNARVALITTLSRTVREFQTAHPKIGLETNYQSLMLAIERSGTAGAPILINFGLDVAAREAIPTSHDFVDWVVRRTAHSCQDFPNSPQSSRAPETISKLNTLVSRHPGLITPTYVEMCCEVVNLPIHSLPKEKSHEQPHEKTRRQRITAEIQADNKAVEASHTYAGGSLNHLIERLRRREITIPASHLFSNRSLNLLERVCREPGRTSNINVITVPSMLARARSLIDEAQEQTKPLLRITYKPFLRITYDPHSSRQPH